MALKNLSARTTMAEGGYDALSEGKGSYRDIMRDKSQATALEQENRVVKTGDVADNLIAEYSERLAQEPGNLKLLRNLAELHTQKKEFDQALAYYQQIRSSDSGGDPTLEKAVHRNPAQKSSTTSSPSSTPTRPTTRSSWPPWKSSAPTSRSKSARAAPTVTRLTWGSASRMGELYFKAGRIGEAIAEFQKAQSNPAKRLQSMSYLGQCFARRNMNDLAARTLQNAIKEKPNFDDEKKELVYSLGCVLEKMNKAEEAIEQFKTIYEMDIAYPRCGRQGRRLLRRPRRLTLNPHTLCHTTRRPPDVPFSNSSAPPGRGLGPFQSSLPEASLAPRRTKSSTWPSSAAGAGWARSFPRSWRPATTWWRCAT